MLLVSAGDEQAEEADAGDGGNQRKAGGRGTPRAAITVNDHVVVLLWCSCTGEGADRPCDRPTSLLSTLIYLLRNAVGNSP